MIKILAAYGNDCWEEAIKDAVARVEAMDEKTLIKQIVIKAVYGSGIYDAMEEGSIDIKEAQDNAKKRDDVLCLVDDMTTFLLVSSQDSFKHKFDYLYHELVITKSQKLHFHINEYLRDGEEHDIQDAVSFIKNHYNRSTSFNKKGIKKY